MKNKTKNKTQRITNKQAVEIACAWHSVMTWSDPGVAMYSVSSTGKIHNEQHRANLLKYIDDHIEAARDQDEDGEPGTVLDTNEDDLRALRAWVAGFPLASSVADGGS